MKAAIGSYETEGKLKLFPSEFGHSPIFVIVDLETGEIVEKKENPFKAEESKDKFKRLAEYLEEVDYFVGKQFGPNALRLKQLYNKVPVVVNAETVEEVIEKLKNAKEKLNSEAYIILL